MKVYHSSTKFPSSIKNPILALGNFDGVHLAHQKMFKLAGKIAKKVGGQSVVYTFEPHPVKILSRASAPPMINTLEQKIELIRETGVDAMVIEPFDHKFAHLGAEIWFEKILIKRLHAFGLVAGYDFTFGERRSGTVETLHKLCNHHNIHCQILEAQHLKDTLISSTQIRKFVAGGEMKLAAKLLGRPYYIDGEVIQGMGRGATIGIRTANLKTDNELLPERGVYACYAQPGRKKYPAVTNVGLNPTFGGQALSIETHLLDFNKDLYGKNLRLEFVERIREERTFTGPQELVEQIKKDIKKARKIL